MLKGLLYKILTESAFKKLSKKFHVFKKKAYNPLSEDDFKRVLEKECGLVKGDVVFVHSSIDKLNIDFPFYKIIVLLQEVVGETGTLLYPCWHFRERAEEYLKNEENIFDVIKSRSVLGVLSEFARRQKDSHRSEHPINSVVASGKNALDFVKDHNQSIYPCGVRSPYYKLVEAGGKIIGLGERTVSLSFVHCVEDLMKDNFPMVTRNKEVYNAKVKIVNADVITVQTLCAHKNINNRDIPSFISKHIKQSTCREFKVAGNQFFTANATQLFAEMKVLAEAGKTIYKR